jgi:hypothetical protein
MVILGVLAGVSGAAFLGMRPAAENPWAVELSRARATAIRTSRAVILRTADGRRAMLLPDGRALGSGIDPLTGEAHGAER